MHTFVVLISHLLSVGGPLKTSTFVKRLASPNPNMWNEMKIVVIFQSSILTHGVYGMGANPVSCLMSHVRRPWFCCFVMAQTVILGAVGPQIGH